MRARSPQEVAAAVGGRLRGTARGGSGSVLRRVVVDSRAVEPGDLFVALAGERADGHLFVSEAMARGAGAALVRRDAIVGLPGLEPLIEVEDPARALLDLARDERNRSKARVVGITGSTGKTCTKDFAAAVLATRYRVVASPASFNNEIGLPLTMLSAGEDTEVLVCEMGSRGRGHIRMLCDVAKPDVGIVTNVGVAHMELFGSPEVLREAKAELPEALPPDGTAVLNADDPVVRSYADRTAAAVFLFGFGSDASVRAEDVALDPITGRARFTLVMPGGASPAVLPVAGEHMVPDALAAAAGGLAVGVPLEDCARGLSRARISSGRMEVFETADGIRVVDDAYNANPTSVAAALKAARSMAASGRCLAVLGPMAELGAVAADEHDRVGELVVRLGIDALITVGADAEAIAIAAEREGLEAGRVHRCADVRGAAEAVRSLARPGDVVLIKASRVARLERIAEALRASADAVPSDARAGA
jgi:UDP-N-acetylmuramoyl-tripeptide--D-alanyl-D-alanine ligase